MIRLKVTTHSEVEADIVEVETYDSAEITEQRNSDIDSIAIGNISYSRIDIKNIKPIEEIVE